MGHAKCEGLQRLRDLFRGGELLEAFFEELCEQWAVLLG